jgi:hypothetical protein
VARVGLSSDPDGSVSASGLALLFAGHEPVAARAAGGIEVAEPAWEAIDAAGVRTTIEEPLGHWTVSFASDDRRDGFALEVAALSPPALLAADAPAAVAGGMESYEQLVRVTGSAVVGGESRSIDCLGQRGHSWGTPDWERIALARTVSAWLDDEDAVTLTAVRPDDAATHADEAVGAFLFCPEGPVAISETRLSTTYDSEGRQRRASLELYVGEEDFAHRLGGDVLAGTTLDLGRLRLDAAFFRWHMDGREGVGRYDVLRRA